MQAAVPRYRRVAGATESSCRWDDMRVGERRDAGKIVIVDLLPGGAELGADTRHLHGIPDQHGVGEQAEAARPCS